jgi:hypothetical protein
VFVADTRIFTLKGWKNISELSGKDKVLVKNFIGDAEFIQPFALRKREFKGELIKFGGARWGVTVTPEHKVVFDHARHDASMDTICAGDLTPDPNRYLGRDFRYLQEDKTHESLILKNGNSTRTATVSDKDWYTILAFVMCRGMLSKHKNPVLNIFADAEEARPFTDILEKYGITWWQGTTSNGIPMLAVHQESNLSRKVKRTLGARARRDMRLPDRILYGSSRSLMRHFINTVTTLEAKPDSRQPEQLRMATGNAKFAKSLELFCLLCGYGFVSNLGNASAYSDKPAHVIRILPSKSDCWSVRSVGKVHYSGFVYEIDLFDGLVYVTEKNLPVWMSPK